MKVLVGIPVYRLAALVRTCLQSLLDTPAPATTVLAVDNAADRDVKKALGEFAGRIQVLTSPANEFCNGGWNRIMDYGLANDFDIIALGSSDAMLHPGWHDQIRWRHEAHRDEVWIPQIGAPAPDDETVENVTGGLAGYFTFLPREAVELVYPIPRTLRHWFGDQYMYEKLRRLGWKTVILNGLRAQHQQSAVTRATPQAYQVIEEDKLAWQVLEACR